MSHQCYTAALWCSTEEGNLDLLLFKSKGELVHSFPRCLPNRFPVVLGCIEESFKCSVDLNRPLPANLE